MKKIGFFVLSIFLFSSFLLAKGSGTSAGLTFLRNSGARSGALGEAFVAMTDDITAIDFNPASLATLGFNQASLHHEQGLFDDSFNKAMLGIRHRPKRAFGISAGFYDSGKANLFDGVNPIRSVTAQQDFVSNLGYGFRYKTMDWGVSIKYLKSQLADTNSASAFSGNIGIQYQLSEKFRMGASGPIYQSHLRYTDVTEEVPRIYRIGMSFLGKLPLGTGNLPVQFLCDVPYDSTEGLASFNFGAEAQLGQLMALRMGFNTRSDIQQFSIGSGFHFRRMNLDYSFGLANNRAFESIQKINFSFQFAGELKIEKVERSSYQLYEVKDGETLESIALSRLGSAASWADIFALNKYMYSSPDQIVPGKRILIPTPKKID
ncbi:MAG: PorV/PorQ family protein [Elusimicrobiota bacterium]